MFRGKWLYLTVTKCVSIFGSTIDLICYLRNYQSNVTHEHQRTWWQFAQIRNCTVVWFVIEKHSQQSDLIITSTRFFSVAVDSFNLYLHIFSEKVTLFSFPWLFEIATLSLCLLCLSQPSYFPWVGCPFYCATVGHLHKGHKMCEVKSSHI